MPRLSSICERFNCWKKSSDKYLFEPEPQTITVMASAKDDKATPEPAASTSKDVYTKTEAIIDSTKFKDQYEMQEQLHEICSDDIEIVLDKESGHFMIKGQHVNVEKALEQLIKLRKQAENGNPVIKETETNAKGGEVQDIANSTGQDVMQNHKEDNKRNRRLVKNLTPGAVEVPLKENIPIDEHVWHYLLFKHADLVANISTKTRCHTKVVPNFSEGRAMYNLEVTTSGSTKNLEDAVEEFAQLYQKITEPRIDEEVLKLPAEWTNEEVNKLTNEMRSMGFMLLADKVYRLIGPSVNLGEAKEKVCESLQKHYSRATMADEQKNDSGRQKSGSGSPVVWKSESNPLGKGSGSPKYDSGAWKKTDSNPLKFHTPGGLHVSVCQGNLIHQTVDAIVNPANSWLKHGGGAARAIADAAGYNLMKESKEYIIKYGEVKETCVMRTSAGNLSPRIKHVIHAVGPQRTDYKNDEVLCQRVKETVYNTLIYANDKLKIQSIAIPAISSGIYGVPLEIVANASFRALNEFDAHTKEKRTLQKIYFLNKDDRTFLGMKELFSSLCKENYGSSVDNETSFNTELFDGYATAFECLRIPTEPGKHCFTRAISTAVEQDLHLHCDYRKVMEDIRRELDTNSHHYKKFQLTKSWFETFKNFMMDSDPKQEPNFDLWLSAAANAYNVQIVLLEQVEDRIVEREFPPQFKKNDKQLLIASYNNGHHHHFDALVKTKPVTGVNGDKPSSNANVNEYPRPITDQPHASQNHYASYDSMQDYKSLQSYNSMESSGPQSLGSSYEKVEKHEADDMNSKDKKVDDKSQGTAEAKPNEDNDDNCIICMDKIVDQKQLSCKHKFCRECIDSYFAKGQPKCPSCGKVFGVLKGDQPKGTMNVTEKGWTHLQGYPGCGTIEITYYFPDGIQGDNHPNPGQRYKGTHRTAYLPANREGKEVLGLLKRAFDADLVFTVGRSNTTGQENVVIWNDVHHKTTQQGPYGYPDPTYLKRVKDELAAKGIQ